MRSVYKPNSVSSATAEPMVIHLVRISQSESCNLPIPPASNEADHFATNGCWDCLILLQVRFTRLPMLPPEPVVSYTTISPLSRSVGTVSFLLHFPYPDISDVGTPPVRRHLALWCSDFPPRSTSSIVIPLGLIDRSSHPTNSDSQKTVIPRLPCSEAYQGPSIKIDDMQDRYEQSFHS